MERAEEIAARSGYKRIAVIAGVGTRGYYRKLGYALQETFMVKQIFSRSVVLVVEVCALLASICLSYVLMFAL